MDRGDTDLTLPHHTRTGPLGAMLPGSSALVTALTADGSARRRLLDLGFVPGTVVTVLRRSPLGDPTAYGIRGTIIGLRRSDADRVLVESNPAT